MALKKKIEIFVQIHDEREFDNILRNNTDVLICAEVYNYAFGFCTALDRLFKIMKLDWSDGKMLCLKVPADEIECLQRFRDHSEPVYLFILNMKVTKVFRGVDMIGFGAVAKKELQSYWDELAGKEVERPVYDLDEPTPDETKWITARALEKEQEIISSTSRRLARQANRKRHRAELMIPHLTQLNFVLYWPHCLHAHPELYERWDTNNIVMVAREMIQVTEELAADIFYAGDAPLNEASLQKLYSGQALALCLRLLDIGPSFTELVRRIIYEEVRVEPHDETKPVSRELVMITAFDYYKSYSPTKEEVYQKRREEKELRRDERKEKRVRRKSVMQRIAKQAMEEAMEAQRKAKEIRKLELLKTGDLEGLRKLNETVEDEPEVPVPEESDEEEELSSPDEEDPDEYFPPPGLLIPGFYAPPNDIAKVNGLAILFPKLVREHVIPQPEFLPPHILVMLEINKRYKAIEAIAPYKHAVLHMGIFKATNPYDSVHIAYTVKQYDALDKNTWNLDEIKIVFMVSIEVDIPLLALVDLNPIYVSRDQTIAEEECAAMFAVDYGDHYNEFEDF